MTVVSQDPGIDPSDEITRLIETMSAAEQRLETLTAGEVDTVANSVGRTFMLQRAQTNLRKSEAIKQAAILDALPALIALVDVRGAIVSVNEAWRENATYAEIQQRVDRRLARGTAAEVAPRDQDARAGVIGPVQHKIPWLPVRVEAQVV